MSHLETHLKVKQRSVQSLIDFVKTRTGEVANYTLLLGSGASVTSGIRSATTLIAEWRRDLYCQLCPNPVESYSPEQAIEYFTQHHGDWYSRQREYASLFEKKFDLPRQRRMFVENEVADCKPSLGYAYLVRLIEKNFINTVFTTNFDDLVNESFHQFSDTRPIVCAHDSSIGSVTVTSKRPKIIKLHGDYLFDDIKSTIRETESLEENTKRKFAEFAKDSGLIVVGYSGHDRSVMDVLSFLLKQDDYFKHGVYWCLRSTDSQSEDLIKLLWKEKVYWVDVDGFDELFSQLYLACIGSELPVSTSLVSQKPREVIQRFCSDAYLAGSKSAVIQSDLSKLKRELDREALVNSLRTVARLDREDDWAPSELNDRDMIKLMEIRQLVQDREYQQARDKISEELEQKICQDYRVELLLSRLEIDHKMAAYDSAIKTCSLLLEFDAKNAYYMYRKAENEQSHASRMASIQNALLSDPYYPAAHRLRAKFVEEQLKFDKGCDEHEAIKSIVSDYTRAIELNPSLQNTAWQRLATFIISHRSAEHECKFTLREIYERMSAMDAYDERSLRLAVDLAKAEKNPVLQKEAVLETIVQGIDAQPNKRKKRLELVLLGALRDFDRHEELVSKVANFDAESRWGDDGSFIKLKAEVYAEVEGRIYDAIRVLESYRRLRKDPVALQMLITYRCYVRRLVEAQKLLDEVRAVVGPDKADMLQAEIYSCGAEHQVLLAYIRNSKASGNNIFAGKWTLLETHALIKLGQYADAEHLAREVLDAANYSVRFAPLIINLELATFYKAHKVNKPRLSKIADSDEAGSLTRMCAFLMLENKVRAGELLINALKRDRTEAYNVKDWAIFDIAPHKVWLNELLATRGWLNETDVRDGRRVAS